MGIVRINRGWMLLQINKKQISRKDRVLKSDEVDSFGWPL